ncbi:MAG: hypothetical protein ABIW79_09330 [Gemmatimonas sp.]
MARLLAVTEHRVEGAVRAEYLVAVGERQRAAETSGVHFWIFEHTDERGRFIEFVEGASESAVRSAAGSVHSSEPSLSLWREVQGE